MIVLANVKQATRINAVSTAVSLCLLQKLALPQSIIHVGAGAGYGEMHQWRQWNVPHAIIIDADVDRLEWVQPLISKNSDWHVASAVLSESEGEIDYYQASNPEEDGIISPQQMSSLWPNLRTTIHSVRPCRRLDGLLAGDIAIPFEQAQPVWVFIDCLPALPILKGAGEHIGRWSVLWLRVLLQPAAEIGEGAALQSIESYLQPLGFRCIEISESNHPAIGYALFARDWRIVLQSRIETLNKANAILTDEISTLAAQHETLTQECYSHANQEAEQQTQIDTLTQANTALNAEKEALIQEKSVLAAQMDNLVKEISTLSQSNTTLAQKKKELRQWCDALEEELDKLTQAHNVQAKLVAEEQSRIETLEQERNDYASEIAEYQAQTEALSQANIALSADKNGLAQEKSELVVQYEALKQEAAALSKARDEQIELTHQRQTQIEVLTQERNSHASQAAERQAQIDTLTQANIALKADKEVLIQEKSALVDQQEALKKEVAGVAKARNEQRMLADQRKLQIDTLTQNNIALKSDKEALSQEKSALTVQCGALKQEIEALGKARDEQNALVHQRKVKIEALTQECESHTNQTKAHQVQIKALSQERDEQVMMAKQDKTELEQLQLQLQQSGDRIARLESELAENDTRQHLLNEEMIKAEAQIELIKDVLLREPGL